MDGAGMRLLPTCQEVQARLDAAGDSPLPFWDRAAIRLHLLLCRPCGILARTLAVIPLLARRLLHEEAPGTPEAARAALTGALRILAERARPPAPRRE
jgi:hypothetical protein